MARKKTPKARLNVKAQISERIRQVRREVLGDHGGPEMARRLGLPARTWYNYETGVTVPAEVLLAFIAETGVDPTWLLTGQGARFRAPGPGPGPLEDLTLPQLIRRGLEALERQRASEGAEISAAPGEGDVSGFLRLDLVPLAQLGAGPPGSERRVGHILVDRRWVAHPEQAVATRLEDDAMSPILPAGSVVAIDRSARDPDDLAGRLVAARVAGVPMVRVLELSGRFLILRPWRADREFPVLPIERKARDGDGLIGQVVWSWTQVAGEP